MKFANWYARAAEKLGALIQMFADESAYVNITGPDGGKILKEYTKLDIPGKYAFTVKPNATAPVDATACSGLADGLTCLYAARDCVCDNPPGQGNSQWECENN